MMRFFKTLAPSIGIVWFSFFMSILPCEANGTKVTSSEAVTSPKAAFQSSPAPSIKWNLSSLTLIQAEGGYGRILRLQSQELLCCYEFQRKVWVRHSVNEGKTWAEPIMVAQWPSGLLSNPELLQLRDGTVLCFYNERPHPVAQQQRNVSPQSKVNEQLHPYAISLSRSRDAGRTWQTRNTLYKAGTDYSNGCWEPAAIELPSGEVQLFFANESPYRSSDEQEITVMRSHDGALTWNAPQTASFRAGSRDGMPVPLVLKDRDGKAHGIAVSIEDNGLSGAFKPVIIFTPLEDKWRSGVVDAHSSRRWSALKTPLKAHIYAGAPYLRQIPSGETVLSFQQSDTGEIRHCEMVVCIGDAQARNFAQPSRPFSMAAGQSQLWASLFVKDKQTITAICNTSINGVHGLWSIDGLIISQPFLATGFAPVNNAN